MSLLENLKLRIRRHPLLYAPVRNRRARNQEQEYLQLREFYYTQTPHVFGDAGYLEYARHLLSQRWTSPSTPKQSPKDVRLFVIVAHAWEHRTLVPMIQRDFDVVIFDYGEYVSEGRRNSADLEWRTQLQDDLLNAFLKAHEETPVDLVFAYGSYTHFDPQTFNRMKATGVPIALMWLDDKHTFLPNSRLPYPSGQKPLIGAVDVHPTNSIETVRWYLAEGMAAFYFAEGCNPDLGVDLKEEKTYDVTFVGKCYGPRSEFVGKLAKAGINIECFGPGWPNGPVPDDDMVRIYKRSWINLGIGGVRYSDRITCLKGRDFDIPATGSAYLTTYDPELARMFYIGKEILCYRNEIDCIEQIRYYLDRPEELEAIGRAAQVRCLREHSWMHRLTGLLRWMGILEDNASSG